MAMSVLVTLEDWPKKADSPFGSVVKSIRKTRRTQYRNSCNFS